MVLALIREGGLMNNLSPTYKEEIWNFPWLLLLDAESPIEHNRIVPEYDEMKEIL